ncbi:MAG: S41 family peptidase [Pedobacter sp.]
MKQTFFLSFLILITSCVNAQSVKNDLIDSKILSEDQRVYGLSQIWSETKYNFVYYDQLKIDWDSLYQATIPKVRIARTTLAYYDELRHFAAQLNDGHTGVWYPMSFYKDEAAYAPLTTSLIEDKVFITAVLNDTLTQKGVKKGMEILKIDGLPVTSYAEKFVSPFEGTSTLQGHNMMVYSTYLLNGPINQLLNLTLKDQKGKIKEFQISRKLTKKEIPAVQFALTTDQIGLLTINGFNADFKKAFDSIYPNLIKAKSLIIDLRNNGGGDGSQGYYLLKHLTKQPFSDPISSFRQYNVAMRVWGVDAKTDTYFSMTPGTNKPFADRVIFEKPIVVLIGKQTYSAAEDFAILFDYIKRGPLIGQLSGGSTGRPFFTELPGGGTFRVCIKKDTYPDGKLFVGVGIHPTIVVPENSASFIKGKDQVMDKAFDVLQGRNNLIN